MGLGLADWKSKVNVGERHQGFTPFVKLFAIVLFCSQAEKTKHKHKKSLPLTLISPASLIPQMIWKQLTLIPGWLFSLPSLNALPLSPHWPPPSLWRPLFEGQIYSKCVRVCSTVLAQFPVRQPPAPPASRALNPPASTKALINPSRPVAEEWTFFI